MFRASDFLGKLSKQSRRGSLLSKLRHGHRSQYGRALQANEASVYSNHVNGEYTNCVRDELGQKNAILNCGQPRLQYSRFATAAAEAYNIEPSTDGDSHVSEEYANVNWDGLGFGLTPTDYMYIMNCSKGQKFSQGTLTRFGKTEMNPSSGILNYGQGLIEGLKAYRTRNERILLFRPEENAMRMQMGAERMCMSSPTIEQFVNAVKQIVHSNRRWVPPPGKGTMYIRPLLIGNGPDLGVAPASEYTFVTYASPVGNYHKGALNLVVEEKFRRATPGGTGGVKAITNYAIIYKPISEAKAKGFTDVLFLDAVTGKYVEEASTSNIFVVKENVISTPPTNGTILPGITRKSIIEIARVLGYQVEERAILVEELFDAEEVFCTGTAVVVNPVNSITYQDKRTEYKRGVGTVGQKLYEILTGIQSGCIEDEMGWTVELD
ncbi:Branched-chain-amino-acid aminotransferase 6 [Citrus sinensis]|uniref:branched-chain-amino-acid aminotransferase 6-like isoform X2 n=1 Tax=Citrus sinensis TaxID=2711 RepID=UPI0021988177|nr:branched-chain-amino-acid aminotransferase 6-like isoform X2 [Citrus sinensis]KAH9655401.1 Branched-chain-amino-acid aminotransferase 6 [Citrus sinensis]